MVLKKSKYGYNRGSTFCYLCRNRDVKETGKIYKFMFGNGHDEGNQLEVSSTLKQYLPDGGLQHNLNYEKVGEVYSLNKRKRWTLPHTIVDVIDNGEVENLDLRLVMHERSAVPFRFACYSAECEVKASTLSYHDSKYRVQHMYPNSRVSSLTDLKLNCHTIHHVSRLEDNTASDSSKRSGKTHTRGIQRRIQPTMPEQSYFHYWRRNHTYFRDVMEGNYHHIKVPEVRYEIHYPDVFDRYCKCPGYRGHSGYFPQSKEKNIKRWKTKGCRSKPKIQQHFKGIDHVEKRFYEFDYIKELEADVADITIENMDDAMLQSEDNLVVQRRTLTFGDFCVIQNRPLKRNRYHKSIDIKRKTSYFHHTKQYKGASIIHDAQLSRKGNCIFIDTPVKVWKQEELQQNEESSVVDFGNDVISNVVGGIDTTYLSLSKNDLEDQFCKCIIDKESVQDMADMAESCANWDLQVSNCVSQQLILTLKGEAMNVLVILWQMSGWSSSSDQAEYWVKLQLETDGNVVDMKTDNLKSKLAQKKGSTSSLDHIVEIANAAAIYQTLEHHRQGDGDGIPPYGHLATSIANPPCAVMSVHEAYRTLRAGKKDILQSFGLVNTIPISSETRVCETCLCESEDPQADGCTLLICQHYFCLDCWRRYILTRIREGTINMPCQAFECKEVVSDVLVRILMPCDLTNQWMNRKKERGLESSQACHWCPTASCDKVALVASTSSRFIDENIPVICACNRTWCFSCQSDVHWPATCDQYSDYRKRLAQNGHIEGGKRPAESAEYYVHVKKCPQCHYPIEKNGGCTQMTCVCSHVFCWECLRNISSHIDGVQCRDNASNLITMSLDDIQLRNMHTKFYEKCVEHRYQWKKTFSNLAIEKKIKRFENSTSYKIKTYKKDFNSDELSNESSTMELRSNYVFLREVHILLENLHVMLSYTPRRKNRCGVPLECLEFCMSRLEHILTQTNLREDDLRRARRLRTSIIGILRTFPYLASIIQNSVDNQRSAKPLINIATSSS
ncbi:uncharacterized protein LOC132558830 [Ylistrum balloti]|uniref:uncharacterized protein LOC132558830 n=1 Tax=Ylistrum balloti TaxID=509963 RepID=UPI002905AE51|nr:uncharacterized protein LOC132558830 [Ylistrum balloti]